MIKNFLSRRKFFVSIGENACSFGFNGKEKDAETGTQDYGFRIYNPSLGKFLSVDPLTKSYPELTPYQFASDDPIANIDLDGLEKQNATAAETKPDGTNTTAVNTTSVPTTPTEIIESKAPVAQKPYTFDYVTPTTTTPPGQQYQAGSTAQPFRLIGFGNSDVEFNGGASTMVTVLGSVTTTTSKVIPMDGSDPYWALTVSASATSLNPNLGSFNVDATATLIVDGVEYKEKILTPEPINPSAGTLNATGSVSAGTAVFRLPTSGSVQLDVSVQPSFGNANSGGIVVLNYYGKGISADVSIPIKPATAFGGQGVGHPVPKPKQPG